MSTLTQAPPRLGAETSLAALRGIGPARLQELGTGGYRVVRDLLFHLPFRYEDRRQLMRLSEVAGEGSFLFAGTLHDLRRVPIRRRGLSMVRGRLEDGTGSVPVVWFNRPYLVNQVSQEEEYLLYGVIRRRADRWELLNPTCEPIERAVQGGRVVPVYCSIGKLGPKTLLRVLKQILDEMDIRRELAEPLPKSLLERHDLPPLGKALFSLHRPDGETPVEELNSRTSPAHRRVIYGEFLELQLELALLRSRENRPDKLHQYVWTEETRRNIEALLPFELTRAQRRVLGEIVGDLRGRQPMLRLLQGDVGCGKTIVAVLALVVAMESEVQAALMAPTEILAEQHYRFLQGLLGGRYRVGLLTGSSPELVKRREELATGEIQLAIGTHALIQEGTRFHRLGLVVIDEQHRFGVAQRRELQNKGSHPDLLVMTATPIPRSLALTAYGDLDLSVIDELPPGRVPVSTRVVSRRSRSEIYIWLEQQLESGAQAYVVFPLIDDSQRIKAAAVASAGEEVRRRLERFPSAILHGRSTREDRERFMADFATGEIRVLVATTLVEVGLDVPGATIMVIESAERFGLAQLHQLRGRIGRSEESATCVAIHGPLKSEPAKRRLEIFADCSDGFRIAEADLELRGPGDLLGTRQAGQPLFRIANLAADGKWLERARKDAREIILEQARNATCGQLVEMARRRVECRLER